MIQTRKAPAMYAIQQPTESDHCHETSNAKRLPAAFWCLGVQTTFQPERQGNQIHDMLQFVLHFGHQQLLLCGHAQKIKICPCLPPLPPSFSTEAMTLITSTRIPTCNFSIRPIWHQSPRPFRDEKTQFRTNMFMTVSVATRINLRTTPLRNRSGEISTCSPRPLAMAHPNAVGGAPDRCKPCLCSI